MLSSDSGCGEPGKRAGREKAKKQLPIAKPPATASHPPPLPRPAGEETKSVAAGRGDTRGGAEGAEDRPFVMSPGKRQGSLCYPTGKAFQVERGGRGCPLAFTAKIAAAY